MGIKRLLFSAHNRDLVVILTTLYFFSFAVYQVSSMVFDVDITSVEQDNQKILFSIISGVVGINVYVTAWVYRTASDRLAAIDVLVSDIYAICRGFVVVGAVEELISSFETGRDPVLTDLPEGAALCHLYPASDSCQPIRSTGLLAFTYHYESFEKEPSRYQLQNPKLLRIISQTRFQHVVRIYRAFYTATL